MTLLSSLIRKREPPPWTIVSHMNLSGREGMKKYLNPDKKRFYERLLTWFGDLKYFWIPPVIVFDSGSYKVKGEDVRQVINKVQPGDILLRSYDRYVDGLFIPGEFSHVGFFYGSVTEEERPIAGTIDHDPEMEALAQGKLFKTGEQMVIHAMADGVFMEDVINFCRCDRMVILRLPEHLLNRPAKEKVFLRKPFATSEEDIYQNLKHGGDISRAQAVRTAKEVVLSCLGSRYDFRFDFKLEPHNSFSCSELVYFAYRSVARYIDLEPEMACIMGIYCKEGIAPDQFLDAGFELVWASASASDLPGVKKLSENRDKTATRH